MTKRSPKEQLDYKKIRDNFLLELKKASNSKKSSISYFKHTFPKKPLIKSISPKAMSESRMVQAFVIGGTNFDVSVARISEKGEITEIKKEHKKGILPKLSNSAIFLKFIKKCSNPKAEAIAINFAYVLEPTTGKFGEVDGILRVSTKEHGFKGLIDHPVGEAIRKFLKRNIPITVANDTICLGVNGLVVGTGFNFSLNGINLEAGNFNRFPPTPELEIIDKLSTHPGGHRFEKFISGSYLPLHFNLLAKTYKLAINHIENGEELSDLAANDFGSAGDLARMLLARSSSLVACALAASYQFMNKKTLTFTTEGSLFWKGWQFEKNLKKQLEELGVPRGAIRFKKVAASSMQGAFHLLTRTR